MPLRLDHGLLYFRTAVGAFIGEVDLRHAPMRLDGAHEHRKSDATRTNDESRLDVIVMVDIGWHVRTPHGSIHQYPVTRLTAYASVANPIMNSREHRKNDRTILECVTDLHDRVRTATTR